MTRLENDTASIYELISEIQLTLRAHDQRFDAIDQRFDGIDQRFDGIDQHLLQIDAVLTEILRRLPEAS